MKDLLANIIIDILNDETGSVQKTGFSIKISVHFTGTSLLRS